MNILEKLLFNLNTLANIPAGRRISTAKEFIVIDEESILQPVARWIAQDSRIKAATVISDCVSTVILISTLMMESRRLKYEKEAQLARIKRIGISLNDAATGIGNLRQTYASDANMIAHLQPIQETINEHVKVINMTLEAHGMTADAHNVLGVRSVVVDI